MFLGDIFDKYNLIPAVIPTLYWFSILTYTTPLKITDFPVSFLIIGVGLTGLQMFFSFYHTVIIKYQNRGDIEFQINPGKFYFLKKCCMWITWGYSIFTFWNMLTHPINEIIMGLIVFYAVGLVFFILILIVLVCEYGKLFYNYGKEDTAEFRRRLQK